MLLAQLSSRTRLSWSCQARAGGILCLIAAATCVGHAQSGISVEGPFTVFRSGGTSNLLTLALPLVVPSAESQPSLRLDLGFATAETDAASTFYDSFSVTLQRQDRTATALVLTADRTGAVIAPPNSGGLSVDPGAVTARTSSFPDLSPAHALKVAMSVTFVLPALLTGGPVWLFLDFFDNRDAIESLAWVANVRIDGASSPCRLMAAADPAGPYVEDGSAQLELAQNLFTLARPASNRFFRVQSDLPVRIVSIQPSNSLLRIRFLPPGLVIQAAANPAGPFMTEARFTLDEVNRRFTGPLPAGAAFWRIAGAEDTVITGVQISGGQVVISYALVRLTLLASTKAVGPYTEVDAYFVNDAIRTISTLKVPGPRFYQLRGNARTRLISVRPVASELHFKYELLP